MSEFARKPKRKYCQFCKDHTEFIDYKDSQMLRKFVTDRGKIKPRRVTGNCAQHQHVMSVAVKRAREMALLPYVVPVISTKVEGRGRKADVRLSPADIRNAILLTVATVAAGFVVLAIPYVGLPLAAFALGWITYRFGAVPATVLALGTAACVSVFGPSVLQTTVADGAFVGVALLAVGPIAAQALRRYPAVNVAAGTALAITLAFLVAPIGADTLKISLEAWRQILAGIAASGSVADPATIRSTTVTLLAQMSATWPATTFYTMGIGTAIGVTLTGRAGRSLGVEVHRYGSLADMDLTFHVVWPAIVGLALTAAGSLWHQAPVLVGAVGENVLMFVRPFLFLQGAAVFAALYRRMGAGRITKTIGFVLLLLTESFVPSVSVLGVVDLFANLRKIPRAHSAPPVRAL